MKFDIRAASPADGDAMLELMPRLAEFELPKHREALHLWQDDAALLRRWAAGEEDCLVHVAVAAENKVIGFSLSRLRPDALSHAPSAHLEAIAVARAAEGHGVAKALLSATESCARERGAQALTLHVISTNKRAREFYEHTGYVDEMLRYIKDLN